MRIALSLTAVMILSSASAAELTLPARKAGQWEIKIEAMAGAPPIVSQVCLDAETDKKLMQAGMSMTGDCSKMEMTEQDGGYVIDAACSFGEMQTVSHTVVTGDFNSTYTMDISSDVTGGPAGMPPKSSIKQTATWLGECTDLAPGEMMMQGMKFDALKMLGGG